MAFLSSWGGFPREEGTDARQCSHGAKAFSCDAEGWGDITGEFAASDCVDVECDVSSEVHIDNDQYGKYWR